MRRKTWWTRTAARNFSRKNFTCGFIFGNWLRSKSDLKLRCCPAAIFSKFVEREKRHGNIRCAPRHRDRPGRSQVSARSGEIFDGRRRGENEAGGCGGGRARCDAGLVAIESLCASDGDGGDFCVGAGLFQAKDSANGFAAARGGAFFVFPRVGERQADFDTFCIWACSSTG